MAKKVVLLLAPLLLLGLLLACLKGGETPSPPADDPPRQTVTSADDRVSGSPVAPPMPSPAPQPSPLKPLVGTVRDAEDGQPLSGALVFAGGQAVQTDAQGTFTLDPVPLGVLITAQAEGYEEGRIAFTASPELEIALRLKVTTVIVRDLFSGQPLGGATVTLGDRSAHTDEGGQVLFRRVGEGALLITQAEGYAEGEGIYHGEPSLEIALRPTLLRGTIRDQASGHPITETLIYVGEAIVSTDEEGAYGLENLPPLPVLVIKASGYRKTIIEVGPGFDPDIALEPFLVKGIYIPFGLLYLPERVRELIDLVDRTELSAVVVDVKSDRGRLAYPSQVPLAQELEAELPGHMDLQDLLRLCQNRGIYTIARMVVFADPQLAAGRPDLAVRTRDGEFWADRKELYWVDPFRQETWDYNIALAKEVAEMGFDEVQVDYVRFPSDGDIQDTRYSQPSTLEGRTGAIRDFFARFQEALRPLAVFTSADVFGLTVWVEEGDMGIGQRVEDVAPYVDYLCPMVYPSTFAPGGLGYANPALHPYQVVYRSYQKGTTRTQTRIRPWLQHFSIRGVEYTLERLLAQKQAAIDADACGWTFWSARGVYDEALFEVGDQGGPDLRQPPP
jgi:hypothetical protein